MDAAYSARPCEMASGPRSRQPVTRSVTQIAPRAHRASGRMRRGVQLTGVKSSSIGVNRSGLRGGRLVALFPLGAGVVGLDALGDLLAVGAEVALVDDAFVTRHERHDAGISVLRGVGDDAEAADQLAIDEEVGGAAAGVGSLRREEAVAVAVIGRPGVGRSLFRFAVALVGSGRDERSQ